MNFNSGFYLLTIRDGRIVDRDGSHSDAEGVAKALFLYKNLSTTFSHDQFMMIKIESLQTGELSVKLEEIELSMKNGFQGRGFFRIFELGLPEEDGCGMNAALMGICKASLAGRRHLSR